MRLTQTRKLLASAVALTGVIAVGSDVSVAQNVPFSGIMNRGCSIVVTSSGDLAADASLTTLSSKNAGGNAGTAIVTSIGNYTMSIEPPTEWDSAPTGFPAGTTTFEAFFSGQALPPRGRTFAEVPHTTTVNTGGSTRSTEVSIHLTGTKTTGGFIDGDYTGVVILRCE